MDTTTTTSPSGTPAASTTTLSSSASSSDLNASASAPGSASFQLELVDVPLETDILCGKDKKCMTHKGSLYFKSVIDAHTVQYREASSRNGKMAVTKKVFDMLVSSSRRFLKLNEETKQWEVLHPLSIRDKIGHALRFANRKTKASNGNTSTSTSSTSKSASAIKSHKRASAASSASSSSSSSSSTSTSDPQRPPSPTGSLTSDTSSCSNHSRQTLPGSPVCVTQVEHPPMEVTFPTDTNSDTTDASTSTKQQRQSGGDLMWILQLPIMELNPLDNKIYFVESP